MKKTAEEAVRKAAKPLTEKQDTAGEENLLHVSAVVCRIPCRVKAVGKAESENHKQLVWKAHENHIDFCEQMRDVRTE